MPAYCDCNKRRVIKKHNDEIRELKWLVANLYEKVGYLKGEVDSLRREMDDVEEVL